MNGVEVFQEAMRMLPADYPDRVNVASVAGYLAEHGRNVTKIARAMGRGRHWVRLRIREAERVFRPALDEHGLYDPGD